MALLRLGWIARFLSKAVITGFLAGAAIDVVIGELPKLTGTSTEGDNAWRELGSWLGTLAETHGTTLLVGLAALALILGLRFAAPKVPGALVLVVGGCSLRRCSTSALTASRSSGTFRAACRRPRCPPPTIFADHAATIAIAAMALLLIGFSQTAGDARAFAARHRYRIDVNQESIAQGMANAGAGVFQGMPVSTSLSASSLNESSGARTPLASLVTGGLVLLTLLVLAPLFSDLPKAVLARVDHRRGGLRHDRRARSCAACAASPGSTSGSRSPRSSACSRRASSPASSSAWRSRWCGSSTSPLGRASRGSAGSRARRCSATPTSTPSDETFDGIDHPAPGLRPVLRHRRSARGPRPRADRRGARGCVRSSWTSPAWTSSTPRAPRSCARSAGSPRRPAPMLRVARMKPNIRAVLAADGVLDEIGEDHIHGNVDEAVEAQLNPRPAGAT